MRDGWQKPGPGDHRCPCPALNSLANGGILPHDGVVTVADLVQAMQTGLGLSPLVGRVIATMAMNKLGKPGPNGVDVLVLSDLDVHGFLEHDASLTRRDARNGNAVEVLVPLVDQLVALSQDKKTLTLDDLAVAHQLRLSQSGAGGHVVPVKAATLGAVEAALLFCVLGRDGAIALPDLVEFFVEERIPAHLTPRPISPLTLGANMAKLVAGGNLPGEVGSRAQEAIRTMVEPEISRCPVAHDPAQ
jgi:hypothetical protein